ncbi:uncharacterized protein LOC144340762 isoform X7 [Macaca mulatta]
MLGGTLSRPLHWAKDCTNHDNGQQGWRERMRCAGQCATSQPTLGDLIVPAGILLLTLQVWRFLCFGVALPLLLFALEERSTGAAVNLSESS